MPSLERAPQRPFLPPLLAAAFLLAACAPIDAPVQYEVPPRPDATLGMFTHEVLFQPGSSELRRSEIIRLERFLAHLPATKGLSVRVSGVADGTGDGSIAHGAVELALRRARNVAGIAEAALPGPLRVELVMITGGGRPSARLTVETATAQLPDCPQPDAFLAASTGADWRLGCATAANLATMVAFPADLVVPRRAGLADGTREAEAVVRYRTDKVKALTSNGLQP